MVVLLLILAFILPAGVKPARVKPFVLHHRHLLHHQHDSEVRNTISTFSVSHMQMITKKQGGEADIDMVVMDSHHLHSDGTLMKNDLPKSSCSMSEEQCSGAENIQDINMEVEAITQGLGKRDRFGNAVAFGPNQGGDSQDLAAVSGPNPGGNSQTLAHVSGPNPGGNSQTLAQVSGSNPCGNSQTLALVSGPNPGGSSQTLAQVSGTNPGGNSQTLALVSGPNPGGNSQTLSQVSGPNPGGNSQTLAEVSRPNPCGNAQMLAQVPVPNPGGNAQTLAQVSGPNPGGNAQNLSQVTRQNPSTDSENLAFVSGSNPGGSSQTLASVLELNGDRSSPSSAVVSGPNTGGNAQTLALVSGPNPGGNSQSLASASMWEQNRGGSLHSFATESAPNPGGNSQSFAAASGQKPGGNSHISGIVSGPNPGGNSQLLAVVSGLNRGGNAEMFSIPNENENVDREFAFSSGHSQRLHVSHGDSHGELAIATAKSQILDVLHAKSEDPSGKLQSLAAASGPNPGKNREALDALHEDNKAELVHGSFHGTNPSSISDRLVSVSGPNPGGNANYLSYGNSQILPFLNSEHLASKPLKMMSGPSPGDNSEILASTDAFGTSLNENLQVATVISSSNSKFLTEVAGGNLQHVIEENSDLLVTVTANPAKNALETILHNTTTTTTTSSLATQMQLDPSSNSDANNAIQYTSISHAVHQSSEAELVIFDELPRKIVPPSSGPSRGHNSRELQEKQPLGACDEELFTTFPESFFSMGVANNNNNN